MSFKGKENYLEDIFQMLNQKHFENSLPLPKLAWNTRLRVCAGRFTPKRFPLIEIASYLQEEEQGEFLIQDTLGHEMIHFWLWVQKKPYGHTEDFYRKMNEMGVSRYNQVAKRRQILYHYQCPECEKTYPARKKLKKLACGECCRKHTSGRYHRRYELVMLEDRRSEN